jgi:hypothetical protein
MACLTEAQRQALPTRLFAIPKRRSYPILDVSHARDAQAMVSKERHLRRDRLRARSGQAPASRSQAQRGRPDGLL